VKDAIDKIEINKVMTETVEMKLDEKPEVKLGRPRIDINWSQFDKLCGLQCTLREISSYFDCSEDTIENRCKEEHDMLFSEYYAQKAGKGKVSLRRKQFDVAMAGNNTMLIWLGKQYLGQMDKQETKIDNTIKINEVNLDQDDMGL